MAGITRQQLERWNAQAHNGFEFDLYYFGCWNEKRLHKLIEQQDGGYIEFVIEFRKESKERFSREYTYAPVLEIKRLKPSGTSGCYTVTTMDNILLGESQEKRAYKTLCECSKDIDTDVYIERLMRQYGEGFENLAPYNTIGAGGLTPCKMTA